MASAPSPCLTIDCYNVATNKGRCAKHQLPAFTSNYRKERLPADWNTRRNIVLKRDNRICYICNGPNADSVDHIINNDDNSLENLKAVHQNVEPYCHRTKTAQEGNTAKKNNRIKQSYQTEKWN